MTRQLGVATAIVTPTDRLSHVAPKAALMPE
jgi:hypothetical protein